MKVTKHLFFLGLTAMVFTACKQTDFKKTKDGLPYKIFGSGKGEKILPGYVVSYHQTSKINDSILGTSYGTAPQFFPIPKDSSMGSHPLAELFLQAHKGDSIQVNQPIDSILRQNPDAAKDPFLSGKKGQTIVSVIKIVDVYKSQEEGIAAYQKSQAETSAVREKDRLDAFNKSPEVVKQRKIDEAAIEQYLKANNIQAQRTPWGAYVQVITPGSGPKPKTGDFAMVRYTGKDFSGKVFDATERHGGELLPVQIGAGRSIPGFEDGLKQLSKGAKAVIYIPSVAGYGAQGTPPNPQTNEQDIKPNTNLIFEVEIVDITDKPSAPSTPGAPDSPRR